MFKNLNDFCDWVQIDRKLVKQTVMTSVYGVTFIGARMQISNRLKERGPIASNPVDTYRAACYAAKVPLSSCSCVFCTLCRWCYTHHNSLSGITCGFNEVTQML